MSVLELSAGERNWAVLVGVVAGVAVGIALPLAWGWLRNVDWIPFHGIAEAIMGAQFAAAAILRPVVLGLTGGAIVLVWAVRQPRLTISNSAIEIERRGQKRVIRREQVAGAYLEGSKLIIDSTEGRRLFDEEVEGAKKQAGPAFTAHGYPWESR
ncbi:YqeB family protein [Mycolicibacterium arenosum]